MIRFKHAGATYVLRPEEIVDSLPPSLKACALKRGKAHKRSEKRVTRERAAHEEAQRKRDRMLTGKIEGD